MKLVVGLGNPGDGYAGTRHNAGFLVVDQLLRQTQRRGSFQKGFEGRYARVSVEGEEAVLLKPQTYMNRSGRSVRAAAEHYDLGVEDLIVIHDDVDLELGTVKVKHGGGAGGHRGLRSCFEELDSRDFDRVRVGVGRPDDAEESVTDYVLGEFDESQRGELEEIVSRAAGAAISTVTDGAAAAMNRWNSRRADHGGEA